MDHNKAPNILARLEELRLWQEQHQSILVDKQCTESKLLIHKQQKIIKNVDNNLSSDEDDVAPFVDSYLEERHSENEYCGSVNLEDTPLSSPRKQFNIEKMEILRDNFCITKKANSKNQEVTYEKEIIKKPFLKRGEGLTSRFRVNPDAFKLNNLPKYKYANAHKKLNRKIINNNNKKDEIMNNSIECDSKKRLIKNKNELNLIKKPIPETAKEESPSNKVATDVNSIEALKLFANWVPHNRRMDTESNSNSVEESIENPIKWSTVLDTQNLTPINVGTIKHCDTFSDSFERHTNDKRQKDLDDLDIFELLEKHADNTSFNLNSTDVSRLDCSNFIEAKKMDEPFLKNVDINNYPIKPYPNEKYHKISIDDSTDDSSDDLSSNDEIEKNSGSKYKGGLHVRFSENIIVNELKNVDDNYLSSDQETFNSTGNTSTPTTKMKNQNEEDNQSIVDHDDTTIISSLITQQILNDKYNELNEKTCLLKNKLIELDKEIEIFRTENNLLIKMKQDHELEKIDLENQRRLLYEELNDEKIRLEVELHDERIKILEDKDKYEKLLKEIKNPNRRERDELIKLKETVTSLEKELKSKESKHVSAQARLRAQMRLMEKELKEQIGQNEELKRENKKIEIENVRLKRQSSNKMLKEINKNINNLKIQNENIENKSNNGKDAAIKKNGVLRRSFEKVEPINETLKNPVKCSYKEKSQHHVLGKSNYFTNSPASSDFEDGEEIYLSKNNDDDNESDEDDVFSEDEKLQQSTIAKSNKKQVNFNCENKTSNVNRINKSKNKDESPASDKSNNLKREIINEDGSKDIWYENGNLKKISTDGLIIRMLYFNKDIKETNIINGIIKYYYNETNTWHTTYIDGLEILEFPNGQKEHRYKNGIVEVNFPNGTILKTNKNDKEILEEWNYPDGTNCIKKLNGEKILKFTNGQIEIHTDAHKRREYPDGTIKFVYPDGSQETRYSNGRIRLKDKNGLLVIDSENPPLN